jgi:hypothetical protein
MKDVSQNFIVVDVKKQMVSRVVDGKDAAVWISVCVDFDLKHLFF